MNTICISISADEQQQELLVAFLQEYFDGFEQNENELNAFISEKQWQECEQQVSEKIYQLQLTFNKKNIENQNWNSVWEQNFSPIKISDQVGVRAGFHKPMNDVQHEIIINPKMSFGTGHHATTAMMMELMLHYPLENKTILDFGSGTGILSILASKMKCKNILAIDHEEWATNNAIENAAINHADNIVVKQGSEEQFTGKSFDVVLANINLNIIQTYFENLVTALNRNGYIFFSGILEADHAAMKTMAQKFLLLKTDSQTKDGWLALVFQKPKM